MQTTNFSFPKYSFHQNAKQKQRKQKNQNNFRHPKKSKQAHVLLG